MWTTSERVYTGEGGREEKDREREEREEREGERERGRERRERREGGVRVSGREEATN